MPMLRDAVVGRIDDSPRQPIAGVAERRENLLEGAAFPAVSSRRGQQALDVLEHEGLRLCVSQHPHVVLVKLSRLVLETLTLPGDRERDARRSADEQRGLSGCEAGSLEDRLRRQAPDVRLEDGGAFEVYVARGQLVRRLLGAPKRLARVVLPLDGDAGAEARICDPQIEAAAAREQRDGAELPSHRTQCRP